ncbi:MAG TPA: hypothetical protein VKI43_04340, partial [Vicinamibacterales bacterium]|nr:hypothetical protein [Vicinamibacterales bacterium]
GCAIAAMVAVAAGRLVPGALFGISAADPVSWLAAILLLLGVSILANLVPAWRAARVDPSEALRIE